MCYQVVDKKTSWPLAVRDCAAMKADVASVNDAITMGAIACRRTIRK